MATQNEKNAKRREQAKAKREAAAAEKAAQAAQVPTSGRLVANVANPSRLGFDAQVQGWATLYGWAYTPVSDPDPRIVHLYGGVPQHGVAAKGGAVLAKGDAEVRVSFMGTRDGAGTRMDAAYLWLPGASGGAKISAGYKVRDTLAADGAAVATPDPARKRGPVAVAETASETPPVVDETAAKREAANAKARERRAAAKAAKAAQAG